MYIIQYDIKLIYITLEVLTSDVSMMLIRHTLTHFKSIFDTGLFQIS
jgi:hypothetical protein